MAAAMAAAMATAVAVAVTRLGLGLVWLCHLIVVLFSEHFRPVKTIAKQKDKNFPVIIIKLKGDS